MVLALASALTHSTPGISERRPVERYTPLNWLVTHSTRVVCVTGHGIVRVSFFRQRWRGRSPWGAPRSLSIYGLMTHADSIKGSAPHSILGRITHTSPSSHSSHTQLSQLSHARTEHHTRAPDHPERVVCAACAHRQYTMAPCAPQKYMQGSRTRAEERAPHAATRWHSEELCRGG